MTYKLSRLVSATLVVPFKALEKAPSTLTKGVNGACSGGVDSTAYSVSLTTTVSDSVAYGAVAMRSRTHTPGSGYTERTEVMQGSGGEAAGEAVMDRSVASASTVPVNGTFSGTVDWAVVAVELRP